MRSEPSIGRGRASLLLTGLPLLLLSACSGPQPLLSRDLEQTFTRAGEGRPAVTALAFVNESTRLAIGDYRGGVELLDLVRDPAGAISATGAASPTATSSGRGEVLALGELGGAPVAVRRSGDPFGWGRLTGATASHAGRFVGWSRVSRKLFSSSAGGAGHASAELEVAAASVAADRVFVLVGRESAAATLQCRALPTLDSLWSIELGHPALALATDEASGRLVVGDDAGVEVRALADGALIERVAAPTASVPVALLDGRRILLVQDEALSVLELPAGGQPARIVPAFLAHRGGVSAVAVSADGALLATGGARGDVRLYRILPLPTPGAAP